MKRCMRIKEIKVLLELLSSCVDKKIEGVEVVEECRAAGTCPYKDDEDCVATFMKDVGEVLIVQIYYVIVLAYGSRYV